MVGRCQRHRKSELPVAPKSLARENYQNSARRVSGTPLNPADKSAEKVAQFGADTPMKRPAQPEEIAPAFVFLAAPSCSSYITGEILPIIGGYSGG
jgi:NAD(P)-dependent dehydrogenase (short-subunit alcohol dehydrogenase family)